MAVSERKEVYGGFASVNLRKPNLMQDDPKKGDYVKGKEEFLGQFKGGGFVASDTPPEDTSLLWVDTSDNSGDDVPSVDLTGYATEQWVRGGYQPKGDYLTEVPDGYAKTEDIPTDDHINDLINTALGVIENGTY